jgi:arylformamidase
VTIFRLTFTIGLFCHLQFATRTHRSILMKKHTIVAAGAMAMRIGSMAQATPDERLRERLRDRMRERQQSGQVMQRGGSEARRGQTIAYGSDALQNLIFHHAWSSHGPAPLILFVHGGGWSKGSNDNATGRYKADHYNGQGYAFASINYRLVPNVTVEQQAADVALSLKALIDRADTLGIDRRNIVLMGHSAGAHLVALVATDEQYLRSAGLTFADVAGVIPIDGACYDVPTQMTDGPKIMHKTYVAAFGTDAARQRALSPTLNAAAPNVGRFMIPYVQRDDGVRQSTALADALRAAGNRVELAGFEGKGLMGHMEINRKLGDPSYPATGAIDYWLLETFTR